MFSLFRVHIGWKWRVYYGAFRNWKRGCGYKDLVTDRHPKIKAYMKKERTDIKHWFDVWHVAKGVYKKLETVVKKKKCEVVGDWARSVSNNL